MGNNESKAVSVKFVIYAKIKMSKKLAVVTLLHVDKLKVYN